jgi:hypothetical protein
MLDPLLQDKEDVFSVVNIVAALLPSPALLLFITRPDLFVKLDAMHLLFLLPGIGVGVMIACGFASVNLAGASQERAERIRRRDNRPAAPREGQKEWLFLSNSSGFANMFLFFLSAWAYWHPLRLGASLVALVVTIVVGSFVLRGAMAVWPIDWTDPSRGRGMGNRR